MTTTEELRRELRRQADETLDWAAPRLRVRPARRRRPVVLAAAAMAVVVALLAVPAYLVRDHGTPRGPSAHPAAPPTTGPTTAPARSWRVVDCGPVEEGLDEACAVPQVVEVAGHRYTRMGYGTAPMWVRGKRVDGEGISIELDRPRDALRWVVVGATGAGASSRVAVTFDDRTPVHLPTTGLRWLRVPAGVTTVFVSELGTPPHAEVLRVAQFSRLVGG